jgi:hypothetical protein
LILSQADNSLRGTYTLTIRGQFDLPIAQAYSMESSFQVTFLHACVRNVVTGPDMDGSKLYYEVTDPVMGRALQKWRMNMSADTCGPVRYTAALVNGQALPSFVKFDRVNLLFSVQTLSPSDEGEYLI